jgi:hypothetical protein
MAHGLCPAPWLNLFVAQVQTGLDWKGEIAGNEDGNAPMELEQS